MDKNNRKDKGSPLKTYIKYTSLGIQILVIILGGYYLGKYLDQRNDYTEPFYEKWIGLAAVFLAIGSVIWQILRESKKN